MLSQAMKVERHRSPSDRDISRIRTVVGSDGVFVYPAGNLYGLGASIVSERAVATVNRLKSRPEGMGVSVLGIAGQLMRLCTLTAAGRLFLGSGDLDITVVLPASRDCPTYVAHEGTLAVRLPPDRLCESLVSALGPITATSANLHGGVPPATMEQAAGQLGEAVALYIDGGRLGGVPTTVVDLAGSHPKVLRQGMVSEEEVSRRYGR